MPVASASKKNNQKRIQLTDTDGWTHIVKGSQAQTRQKHLTPVDKLQPTAVSKGWTIPRGCDMLERYRKTIKDSQLLAQVNGILESQVFVAVAVSITRCVCLGLGSMTGQTGNEESSWHQLAFLVSLVEILRKRYMIETIYVQDPTFNRVDMALLKRVGCTVLESPDAFDRMTSDTFLFDPHLEWKHTVRALDVAHPSLRIGNTIDSDLFCSDYVTSHETDSLQRYVDGQVQSRLPKAGDSRWSFSLGMFWASPSPSLQVEEGWETEQHDPRRGKLDFT